MLTFGSLFFSDQLSNIWKPLFSGILFVEIKWEIAIVIAFLGNIIFVSLMVYFTGGSMRSPFSPIYFILPALAIFLREPGKNILLYLILVILGFSLNTRFHDPTISIYSEGKADIRYRVYSYWVVSISCLLLATVIGYVTRPR
jgi:hypothetical protein